MPLKLQNFFSGQLQWTRTMAAKNIEDPYWYQMSLILAQFDGLLHGTSFTTLSHRRLQRLRFRSSH